jgi:predicted hydrolase (HD superfamily)
MEETCSSEALVAFQCTRRPYIQEDRAFNKGGNRKKMDRKEEGKMELNHLFVVILTTLSVAQIIIASSGRMTGE